MRIIGLITIFIGFITGAHESPIDHVDRTLSFSLADGRLELRYRVRQTPRAALLQLRAMDADSDGQISAGERAVFFQKTGEKIARELKLNGQPFRPMDGVKLRPDFSAEYRFTTDVTGESEFIFRDEHAGRYPGQVTIVPPTAQAGGKRLLQIERSPRMKVLRGHVGLTVLRIRILK